MDLRRSTMSTTTLMSKLAAVTAAQTWAQLVQAIMRACGTIVKTLANDTSDNMYSLTLNKLSKLEAFIEEHVSVCGWLTWHTYTQPLQAHRAAKAAAAAAAARPLWNHLFTPTAAQLRITDSTAPAIGYQRTPEGSVPPADLAACSRLYQWL